MAAAYANSFSGPLVFDDFGSIERNPSIRKLWPIWALFRPPPGATVSGRPVTNFSFALSYALSGTRPWGHHALNVAIHAAAAFTLYGVVRRTLLLPSLRARFGSQANGLALAVAALWALHPLQTEAVTYLVQRAESLMGLCYLLVFYAFLRAVDPVDEGELSGLRLGWALTAWAACCAGMGAKEVMVSAPFMLVVFDRYFVAGSWRALRQQRGWFHLLMTLPALWLVWRVARHGGRDPTIGFHVAGVKWGDYLLTQFPAVVHYLRLCFWPHPLIFDYAPFWVGSWKQEAGPLLICLALVGSTALALRSAPRLGFLGLFFFAILAPTSLVPGASQMIVEHRMYLALIPIAVLTVLAVHRVTGRRARLMLGCGAALALGAATAARNATYHTALALWTDTVVHGPPNGYARNILGTELQLAGRKEEALTEYLKAEESEPTYGDPPANAGEVLLQLGRLPQAEAQLREAVRREPLHAAAWEHLGTVLGAEGRPAEADAAFRRAGGLAPEDSSVRSSYGNFLLAHGRVEAAIGEYRAAVAAVPERGDLHYNLANALMQSGDLAGGERELRLAIEREPNEAEYCNNLATACGRQGRLPEAARWLERALTLRPAYWQARYNYALTLQQLGREREAAAEMERVRSSGR